MFEEGLVMGGVLPVISGSLQDLSRVTHNGTEVASLSAQTLPNISKEIAIFTDTMSRLRSEVGKSVVGMELPITLTLSALFTGSHILLEGSPGLAKTLLANSVANCLGLSFKRIQFTPDLLPGDITGSLFFNGRSTEDGAHFRPGPIFANIVLADEINRASPKTQSALLEAMQEGQVTVDGATHKLPSPFLVIATQNPYDQEGTYPLPQAELDRFGVKVNLVNPSHEDLIKIVTLVTATKSEVAQSVGKEFETSVLPTLRQLVSDVQVSQEEMTQAMKLVSFLDPKNIANFEGKLESGQQASGIIETIKEQVTYGPSPRGGIALIMLAKFHALLEERAHILASDIIFAAPHTLAHRMGLKPTLKIAEAQIVDDAIKFIYPNH